MERRNQNYRMRRVIGFLGALLLVAAWLIANPASWQTETVVKQSSDTSTTSDATSNPTANENITPATDVTVGESAPSSGTYLASTILERLEIKGRAPKTGYARTEFYNNWPTIDGCSLRQRIIKRELGDSAVLDGCDVISGFFTEPYTGSMMTFYQKSDFSQKIQIDHVVALSDAWQKGAQYQSAEARYQLATDPLNLLAVDSSANQQKSDGDAATWLPPNKLFRCQYVARQVSVKYKYSLWVTPAEHDAIAEILAACPDEPAVGV